MLLVFISPVIGRFSLSTEGDPCFAIPASSCFPSNRKEVFRSVSSAFSMSFTQVWGFAFVLALPRSFFSPSFQLLFTCLKVTGLKGRSFCWHCQGVIPVPLVSLSPPLPFSTSGPHSGEWLVESYYCSCIWFIHHIWLDMAQGVRAVVWQSEGCRFDPTLGVLKCPRAKHLTPNCSWRAGWYLAWQPIAVGVWMGEWEAYIVKRFG